MGQGDCCAGGSGAASSAAAKTYVENGTQTEAGGRRELRWPHVMPTTRSGLRPGGGPCAYLCADSGAAGIVT